MIITQENYKAAILGAKAQNLFLLTKAGFPVPRFFCVDEHFSEAEVLTYLRKHFPDTAAFSVRSCAALEDSAEHSFAGQFRTFLRVPKEKICARIRDVLSGGKQPENSAYCKIHHLNSANLTMHVVIQEMIEADISGVLFTANPRGPVNESVIVCGAGTGDLVVEDKTDTTAYYYNLFDRVYYYEQTGSSPLLPKVQVEQLIDLSGQAKGHLISSGEFSGHSRKFHSEHSVNCNLKGNSKSSAACNSDSANQSAPKQTPDAACGSGTEYDIEFAIRNDVIYILQARPVTTLDKTAPAIILDNSNIVESYPGITLPFTQSFIRIAYYEVFKNLLIHLTGEPETVRKIDDTLQHMVDVANGRIYYRISNWYDVLLFLPFHSRLIPIWQEMMGIRDKSVSSGIQSSIRLKTRLKVARSFFRLLRTCPKEMDKLDFYFQEIINRFDALDISTGDNKVLLEHYRSLQDMTVKRWDMTLVNDMYGFLFTGLLKMRLKAGRVPDCELAANRAISGIGKLESMRPVQELQNLARQAKEENLLAELGAIDSNKAYDRYVQKGSAFSLEMQNYIQKFGDRNVEELKLESRTFRTDPVLLVRCILQYAETLSSDSGDVASDDANAPTASSGNAASRDTNVPTAAQPKTDAGPQPETDTAPPPLTGLSAFYAKKAAVGIRNREKSRLNRGRLYGMMRTLVLQMGQNLYHENRIDTPEDIFYLYCEEIDAAASDRTLGLREIIADRKKEYEGFTLLPAYSRLVFSGKVTDKHPKSSRKMQYEAGGGTYMGIACSPGTAEGEVLLIDKPSPSLDTKDRILVTRMTDPGWVFLIAPAKAIVSEKGSLLSHTAIISRELKKPAVVGTPHITEYLKTGDRVWVDGDTGTVTILKK